ncbi:TrbG/VirB9 family P-type conjugative transfer protein (plasmid) [Komagataeibacter nataicola]|jgi:type IV secretion system protein VirB9|nr:MULTISPECIES: TrbG/VirB9 family P-type conjugative transfer protein [Acetobacteraceae]WEQ54346.1 TrbG/VirB9 family P-type conjugative transfer protein [Komagataeibacter nataicola]GBQ29206.1 transport secretion system IV VirB9 protein [Acetobacter estunensis NRIC 0472]GCD51079.1 transport secretion system IV VirB9 protein [Acetobacter pasteurianus subsp. pasteurianus LMG 1262 = NBRC 106471]
MKYLAAAAFLAATYLSVMPAFGEQDPLPSRHDTRMRYVPYVADQVVHLSTAVGATLVIGFGAHETVDRVAVSDSIHLKAAPAGNYLFFKATNGLSLQPVVVLTRNDTGQERRYVFEVQTVTGASLANSTDGVYYSVQFTYPADEAAARRVAALARQKQEQAQAEARAKVLELQLAHERMERETKDPNFGTKNWKYIAKGDRSITPLEVWDNGNITIFRFPGNVRLPSLFTINPDGKEATANYSVKNDPAGWGTLMIADHLAPAWRLRDGDTVLCVFNKAFDPVGHNPGTNTISPNVVRTLKEAAQ